MFDKKVILYKHTIGLGSAKDMGDVIPYCLTSVVVEEL